MCVSVSKNLCALPQMQNRDHSTECRCLGSPGLRQCDQPSRPQRAWGQPFRVVSQKASWYHSGNWTDLGPTQAGDLGSVSPCCGRRSVHLLFFLTAAKPYCRGQRPGPFADGWRAVICWCCSGWSPRVSLCLVISHNSSARTWLAQEELFSFPGPNSVLLLMKMNQTYRCGFAFYPSPST